MTALAMPRRRLGSSRLLFMILLAGVAIMASHAIERHGNDAVLVRQSICKNGSFATWVERDGCTKHNLTRMDDGRVGNQITVDDKGQTWEVTSFIPRGGNLEKIVEWLLNKSATLNLR